MWVWTLFLFFFPLHNEDMVLSMWLLVNGFSKMAHFMPCNKIIDLVNVASLYFHEVYCLHDLSTSIVYYCDTRFLSRFWRSLWKMVDTQFDFTPTYHPHIDWQTEVINRAFGDLLCSLVGYHLQPWDLKLSKGWICRQQCCKPQYQLQPFPGCLWLCQELSLSVWPLHRTAHVAITLLRSSLKNYKLFTGRFMIIFLPLHTKIIIIMIIIRFQFIRKDGMWNLKQEILFGLFLLKMVSNSH